MDDMSELPEAQAVLESKIFPLALTPLEKYLYWDKHDRLEMVAFYEMYFEGPLRLDWLRPSLTTAVHRNPLFACTISEQDGELYWEYDSQFQPQLLLEEESSILEEDWPRTFDLRHEKGCRFWYQERQVNSEIRSRLLLQIHHAVCDGIGTRRFVAEACTAYAATHDKQTSTENSKSQFQLGKVNLQSLENRFELGPPAQGLTTWQRIKNARYFHFATPRPLLGSVSDAATSNSGPDGKVEKATTPNEPLRHRILSRDASQRILEKTRIRDVSVNEVALALLFKQCYAWNSSRGDRNSKNRIRILMPYEFRSRVDLLLPACNRLSFAFLGRTYKQCQDLDHLLSSVKNEIADIKQSRLPMDFIEALKLGTQYPKAFQWIIRKSPSMATAILTYTGDLLRGLKSRFPEANDARIIGDGRLTNVMGAPPVKQNSNIAICLSINWGQLCISAAWNRHVLTSKDCEQFLEEYEGQWTDWAELS